VGGVNYTLDGEPGLTLWSTDTTEAWAEVLRCKAMWVGRPVTQEPWYRLVYEQLGKLGDPWPKMSAAKLVKYAHLDPDYWGAVDLWRDKLVVVEVRLNSKLAETWADVDGVFNAVTDLVIRPDIPDLLVPDYVENKKYSRGYGLTRFGERVEALAQLIRKRDDRLQFGDDPATSGRSRGPDVVLIHRGGGLHAHNSCCNNCDKHEENTCECRDCVSNETQTNFLSACQKVRNLGIEVVIGLGHGAFTALAGKASGLDGIGIHEALTPTDAAQWIVKEHLNGRIADTRVADELGGSS